jgi:galactitol-specific phosphotransferase system IIC component
MKFHENVYSHGSCNISDLLNRSLHEFFGLTPARIKKIFYCNVLFFCMLIDELLQKIFQCFIID